MIIVGANTGETAFGKPLRDGGAAVIVDGRLVYASAEERHTGVKAAGGYAVSLAAGMEALGLNGPDRVFLSSCCEPVRSTERQNPHSFVDHHLSHAALAYFSSQKSDALLVVCDAGGNVVDGQDSSHHWWTHKRQQLSLYRGNSGKITYLGSHFLEPMSCGLGEMYRAFTYFLGWKSGRQAGKVMALAGAGERLTGNPEAHEFYDFSKGMVINQFNSFYPHSPIDTAKQFLKIAGREDLSRKWLEHEDHDARLEVAKIAQWNLERSLTDVFKHWLSVTKLKDVCFAGGVALNCTAVRRLEDELGCSVFVPPGCGDNGQSVGNAILGHLEVFGSAPEIGTQSVFLGREYSVSENNVIYSLNQRGIDADAKKYIDRERMLQVVAERLFSGEVVYWFQGKGEFGSRALGNRSILASPGPPLIGRRLNALKQREQFNPFAASCIYDDKDRFFINAEESPFMTKAFKVLPEVEHEIPAVVHDDGTCRAQIFKRDFNPLYYDLLSAFKRRSDFGLLLNTSLNGSGEPIIETPEDAIAFFKESREVNTLVLNDIVITKRRDIH